jgi:hypothetical protein
VATVVVLVLSESLSKSFIKLSPVSKAVPSVVLRRLSIVAFYFFLKFYFKIVSEASLPL